MRKLAQLMFMALVMCFVACGEFGGHTDNGNGDGNGNGGSNDTPLTFNIEVSSITSSTAKVTITPSNENTYYFDEVNGNMKTGWQKIDGEWYLFNASGEELFGWQKMGGAWYYLDEATGIMLTGFQTLEWDGVEATYYLNDLNGNMQTGWIDVDGVWYYAYANGTIATNTTIGNWTAGDDGIFTEIA